MLAVDASFALKLFLNEPDSQLVRQFWQDWTDAGEVIIAPTLFRAETFSVVRRHWHTGALAEPAAERAFHYFDNLAIEIHEPRDLYRTAWELAGRFNRPTVYDCCYLALAAIFGCDFWTADRRLVNALGGRLPWVRTLT